MTFEKALEAMKQGKKIRRMSWNDGNYICFNFAGDIVDENGWLFPLLEIAKSGGWRIYEEPQKEPEMTAEKAVETLRDIRKMEGYSYTCGLSITEFRHAIEFAIESLENQNQPKPEKKSKCEFNCKIQPAKFFPDDMPALAFDMFTSGLKFGLEIAKNSQKENENNA